MRPSEPFEICPFEIRKYKLYICLKNQIEPNDLLESNESAKLLENFLPQNVQIITTVFYGSARVRSIAFTGKTKLIVGNVNQAKQDRKEFEIVVSHEKFHFYNLDPSGVEGIDGDRDTPYVIIRLIYVVTDQQIAAKLAQTAVPGSTTPGSLQLGYARVEMNKITRDGKNFWNPPLGSTKVDLTPRTFRAQKNSVAGDFSKELVLLDSEGSYIEVGIFQPNDVQTPGPSTVSIPDIRSDQLFPKRTFWTQYNPRTQAILPPQISNAESFDIYIDQVKFLPDNCSMCKVTGRIFKSGLSIPDLEALPKLDSDSRSPMFEHRTTVHISDDQEIDCYAVLVIRVYIQDNQSSELVVLGSGLLVLYQIEAKNKFSSKYEGLLNHGGHQVRLCWGFPAENIPLGADSFRDNTPIPGTCSVLIRLLPHTKEFVAAPNYQTGYYKSDTCEPTESDVRVLSHYLRYESFPKTVRDSLLQQLTKKGRSNSQSDENIITHMRERLDRKNLAVDQHTPRFVQLENCLDYDIGSGVFAKIEQAYGLSSENVYCSCFARLSAGEKSLRMDESPEGFGGECKFLVNSHNYTSLQTSPRWNDKAYKMNPHFDKFTYLLIQIFALDAKYVGDPNAQKPGTVLPKEGKEHLALEEESRMGWTAVNLFRGKSANTAIHYLPVFEEQPSLEFMESALNASVLDAMVKSIDRGTDSLNKKCASLKVKLFDGNFVNETEAIPLRENFDLEKKMASIGGVNSDAFDQIRKSKAGKVYSDLVLYTMPPEDQRSPYATLRSNKYKKAEHYYEMAMSDTFYNLLEDQMMEAAMGPFTKATSDEQFDPESLFYNFG